MQSRQFSRVRRTRKVHAGVLTHGKDVFQKSPLYPFDSIRTTIQRTSAFVTVHSILPEFLPYYNCANLFRYSLGLHPTFFRNTLLK